MKSFFETPTIKFLSDQIKVYQDTNATKKADFNLSKDYELIRNDVASISKIITKGFNSVKSLKSQREPSVLLTGANGFLGVHLLETLHRLTNYKIYCLVRGCDVDNSRERFIEALSKYGQNHLISSERVIVISGDVSKDLLGVEEQFYYKYLIKVSCIYHCAAFVNHLYNYSLLKDTNVIGVKNIIELAQISGASISYISSLAANSNNLTEENLCVKESWPSDCPVGIVGGYPQSKWVAEKLLQRASALGIKVKIFRPSFITGNSISGCGPTKDIHLNIFIKGCLQLGGFPKLKELIHIVPVDLLSDAIVKISQSQIERTIYNVTHPVSLSWSELLGLLTDFGYNVKMFEIDDWSQNILPRIKENNALFKLIGFYINMTSVEPEKTPVIETKETLKVFNDLNINIQDISSLDLWRKYFDYFRKIGFL
jgi:thioester reductase-like protein